VYNIARYCLWRVNRKESDEQVAEESKDGQETRETELEEQN